MTIAPGDRFEARKALRQALERAVLWGMIDVNPAKHGVDNPQRRYTEKRPFDSWAELAAVAAKLGPRNGPMVLFAAATGLRPGEWIALEQRDIDQQARVVYVRRAYRNGRVKCTKTEASVRAVPLQAIALAALEQLPPQIRKRAPVSLAPRRAPRSAQLPQPRLETRPARRRDHAAAARLRSTPHLRDLRPSCRHL